MIPQQSILTRTSKVFYAPKQTLTIKLSPQNTVQHKQMPEFFKILFCFNSSQKLAIIIKTSLMLLLGLISMGFGINYYLNPSNRTIARIVYDRACQEAGINALCELPFEVTEKSESVSIFYRLPRFIANHKEYLVSRSTKQLRGQTIKVEDAKKFCYPFVTNRDMNKTTSWNGTPLDPNAVASPCGYQAFLFFQDIIDIVTPDGLPLAINRVVNTQVFRREEQSEKTQWIDPTSDSFEVWMTTSVGELQKIYGRVVGTVKPGQYYLRIRNKSRYPGVSKQLIFMQINSHDGSNRLVGTLLITLGPILSTFIAAYVYMHVRQTVNNKVPENSLESESTKKP